MKKVTIALIALLFLVAGIASPASAKHHRRHHRHGHPHPHYTMYEGHRVA
jgi:hypothetical protein